MADLLSVLSGAATSLAAQRAVSATASHNIDNANTPGYARQTASLVTNTPAEQVQGAFIGRGATLDTISQARDRFLEAQLPRSLADAGFSTAKSDALQAFHGFDVGNTGGLGSAISGFFTSLRALAQNTGDPNLRAAVFGAAQTLARGFNSTATAIESARSGLDAQASGLAGRINTEAQAVAELNVQIRRARASGAEPNDLLDLRQRHLDELSELAGTTTVASSEGDVNVALPGGTMLVAGARAAALSTTVNSSGHLDIQIQPPDGSGPTTLSSTSLGGSLGGTLEARDDTLAKSLDRVNLLATELAEALNAQHQAGLTPSGAAGGAMFDTSGARGAAAEMRLVLSDPSALAMAGPGGGAGDATNANALLDVESTSLPNIGKDPQAAVADIVAQFGNASATAKAVADQDGAVKDHLSSLRESYSGVSIDEEMITLQQAQRAYEAIAKVIQTTDQMMQTLMNLK